MRYERYLAVLLLITGSFAFYLSKQTLQAQEIFRFDHINTENGLSQNTVSSILCDSKGFLWLGTNDGLNRYDGYNFKIFRSNTSKHTFFTNNRIVKIWEDALGFIWFSTHDGYYHILNPEDENIISFPRRIKKISEGNLIFTSFVQYSKNEIWLGLSTQGLLKLKFDPAINNYQVTEFSDRGQQAITNNNVSFIHKDNQNNLWIGTDQGINFTYEKSLIDEKPFFQHLHVNHQFTSSCETKDEIWFGTKNAGLIRYAKKSNQYTFHNTENTNTLPSNNLTHLFKSKSNLIFAAFENQGLYAFLPSQSQWKKLNVHGTQIDQVYQDHFQQIWVTSEELGLTRIDPKTFETKYYQITPIESGSNIPDSERHFFFEDRNQLLWLGLHGGALALYDRKNDQFKSYRNNPQDPHSISSNTVHCITEDHSGQLWVGTGLFTGGLEKIILKSPGFQHTFMEKTVKNQSDNIARAIYEDSQKNIWVATKAGRLYVLDEQNNFKHRFNRFKTQNEILTGVNIYSILIDNDNYLWLASKGKGIMISSKPLSKVKNYNNLDFINYKSDRNDSTSLSHNNVYSLTQDSQGNVWIGTYGNGLNRVHINPDGSRWFKRINTQNSNLSSNMVRSIFFDSKKRMWIATGFGLNLLKQSVPGHTYQFQTFLFDPEDKNSISYNDVVHIIEDSQNQIWIGTMGGGVCKIELINDTIPKIKRYSSADGLSSDIVYGILEDLKYNIWFSTENGLNRFNKGNKAFEVFNTNNGLSFSNFSENTCLLKSNGSLVFGGYQGIETVDIKKLTLPPSDQKIELTNFQLFNKTVSVTDPESPLKKSISYTDKLVLDHRQSSFSFEYSALDLLDPTNVQYAFILENFDRNWNYVGNQTKATYTNLSSGEYTFKIKATNRQGGWSSKTKEINITILPPWWKTSPAYLGYLVLAILFLLIIKNTISRINRYRNDLVIAQRVNDEKLKFFTNISHEIRTPLTLILGPVEDLLKRMGDSLPEYTKDLNIIFKNGKRMLQLVNQLLEFRKVQNNKMILRIQQFDIVSFTREISESFQPLAVHKGITLTFHSDMDELQVWGDPSKLDIVVYNLVSNAVKFTNANKKVEINITGSENKDQIVIAVKDEGPGISQENLKYLFTRYSILSDKELSGTGIGLSLAYEITKLHHGDLEVNSTENEGSTFMIKLKTDEKHFDNLDYVTFQAEETPVMHPSLPEYQQEIPKIQVEDQIDTENVEIALVVEDNPEIQNYICQCVQPKFNCIVADHGEEGLKLAEKQNPDIIITDVMMPVMDGFEMTKKLKESFNTSHIPVIMLTAKTDIKDRITGLQTGADTYIQKPFNTEHLLVAATNLIEQRKRLLSKFRDNKTLDPETLKVNSKDEEFLDELVKYIEKNYTEEFTIEQLVEFSHTSRTVFYNKIKGLTGMSPIEFVRQIKLKIAAQLIEKGFNVSEASFEIGFNDVKYFSRQFKKLFGYPPSQHKRRIENGELKMEN